MRTAQAAHSVADTAGQAAGQTASSATDAAQNAETAINGAVSTFSQVDGIFSWGGYFQALALLFLIVALLWAALWYLKRRGGIKLLTKQGDLNLESRMALGPKKYLVVVRFLNKRLLLGVTDQQITMLTELPDDDEDEDATASHPVPPPEPAPDPKDAASFQALLHKADQD